MPSAAENATKAAPVDASVQLKNVEAEQGLLSILLQNNRAYETVGELLSSGCFSDPLHGKIYEAMRILLDRGQVVDPITLTQHLSNAESDGVDVKVYVVNLASSPVSIGNARHYSEIIYDLHLRRELVALGHEVVAETQIFGGESSANIQIEQAEQRLFDLATQGGADASLHNFSQALTQAIATAERAYQQDGHVVGITSGLADMDHKLGGFHPSDLLILAGRPSMGKTALATNIAFQAALAELERPGKGGAAVAFFSLEMSAEQLAGRLLAQVVEIPSDRIRRGDLTTKDFPKFLEASRRLAKLPLYIDDTPALSISALRTRARRLKRKHNVGFIIIDYLQLLQGSAGGRSENRVQEISEITRGLKALAKELQLPIIALSQLSRAVEQRDDKRPQLSDLRESGTIEQDSDIVMFIYREEYYLARKEPREGTEEHRKWQEEMNSLMNVAEVIIAKQRHGPIGTVKLFYEGPLTKFGNLSDERLNQQHI